VQKQNEEKVLIDRENQQTVKKYIVPKAIPNYMKPNASSANKFNKELMF
jgi:hypothetical protein